MKDFLQTLLGIIIVGAVIMALILFFFPNPEALGTGNTNEPEQVPELVTLTTEDDSFADELLPAAETVPVYQPLADELLTGDAFNCPKTATMNMFGEEVQTVTASKGNSVAPSRIVVQTGSGQAYVWCEFEYDPQGTWMKQRIYPLKEGEKTYEILYNQYGSVIKTGIARTQLITYDKGYPSEGIGMDQEGRYRYFKREDTDIDYDTDLLYYLNHTDEPLYKIELREDLVNNTREEKLYEQRINGGDFYIFQHRVIDTNGMVRRIVDFSKYDNTEPLLKASREYDEQERLISDTEYDKNRNVTQAETFAYDAQSGLLKSHTRTTSISGIMLLDETLSEEDVQLLLTNSTQAGAAYDIKTDIRYADYFDRPDDSTVRRLSVNEINGETEEMTYHITRNAEGLISAINAESTNITRSEQWTYDGNGNWIDYRLRNGDDSVFQMQVSYRETAYPYNQDVMQRRILSLEPLQFAAFMEETVEDAFWWCAPQCTVEERFVLSGFYY